jgi:ComF family protein
MLEKILDFLFPRSKIQKNLDNITVQDFYSKARKTTHENKNFIVVFSYEDRLVKEAIHSLKFKNNKKIAKIFAEILYSELLEELSDLEKFSCFKKPILIPIPLSRKKLQERGYNQCEIIAKEMSFLDSDSNFSLEKDVLIKKKDTPPQSRTKNKKERLENLKNCFKIKNPEKITGQNIILLDDITTTGTTLKEASYVLRKNGVKKIICLTIAH